MKEWLNRFLEVKRMEKQLAWRRGSWRCTREEGRGRHWEDFCGIAEFWDIWDVTHIRVRNSGNLEGGVNAHINFFFLVGWDVEEQTFWLF